MRAFTLALSAIALALFAACRDGDTPIGPPSGGITPGRAALAPGQLQSFAMVGAAAGAAIEWRVNGIAGGSAALGTIDAQGRYAAPATLPLTAAVEITAVLDGRGSRDTARVALLSASATGERWHGWDPVAVSVAAPAPATLTMVTPPEVTSVYLELGQGTVPLERYAPGVFRVTLQPQALLQGYRAGDGHNLLGRMVIEAPSGVTRLVADVNVLDDTVAAPLVTRHADDVQSTPYVVNIRRDQLDLGKGVPSTVIQRFYQFFPDAFDFIGTIEQVSSTHNRFYQGVRNDVRGIGLSLFDNGAIYGSAARLQGLIHYPISTYFDLAELATSHEIGHRWINFLRDVPGAASGVPHWPIGDAAYGIMGFTIPGGAGGTFPWTLTPLGNGDYRVDPAPEGRAVKFHDMELYLMGLLPADSVAPHFTFENQNQGAELRSGGTLRGPTIPLTVQEIIQRYGAREPGVGSAQTEFRLATIVLSAGRLLTPTELTFFHHMARRGEAATPLPFRIGFLQGLAYSFHLATGGRARLWTSVAQ